MQISTSQKIFLQSQIIGEVSSIIAVIESKSAFDEMEEA
jgi:hypothetical protein